MTVCVIGEELEGLLDVMGYVVWGPQRKLRLEGRRMAWQGRRSELDLETRNFCHTLVSGLGVISRDTEGPAWVERLWGVIEDVPGDPLLSLYLCEVPA